MLLGCIADGFTGASDLANTLTAGGMRTAPAIDVPAGGPAPEADAVVVAPTSAGNMLRAVAGDVVAARVKPARRRERSDPQLSG